LVTPAIPIIASTAPTCSSEGISTISNYDSSLTYTFNPTGPTIASTGVISGMIIGTDYAITSGNVTCTSLPTSVFRNNTMLITPNVPTIVSTAPTCLSDGISTISNYDSSLTYTFNPTGPSIASTGIISGMITGTDYTLTSGNTTCTSAQTSAFRNNAMLVTPAIPTIISNAPTCSSDGISTISNYDSSLTYTFNPTGPSISSTGIISGMIIGTDYTITSGNTTCTSAQTSTFRNNAMLVTPIIPSVVSTAPTCSSDGISTISNYDSSLTYTFNPTGPIIASTGVISGMILGTDYTLTAGNTTCTSAQTSAFRNNAMLITPTIPLFNLNQQTCAETTGSFTITNYNATYNYVITPSAGVTQSGNIITAPAGTYNIVAQANVCESPSSSVVIDSKICAIADNNFGSQTSSTTITNVGNVTTNDTLNGFPVTQTNINVTPKTTGPLSVDANGELTLAPNTASGTYTIDYTICENAANPANCANATATVIVGNTIIALTENTQPINGSIGGTTFSLTNNDTLNGNPVVIANNPGGVILTAINVPIGLILNDNGTVTVKAGTPIGNYEIEYSICEYLSPTNNCATVKSYIPVTGAILQANNDNAGTVDSNKGQNSATNIFHNDTLNGSLIDPESVTLKTIISNPNLTLNSDGTITVKSGTPAGNYELTYQICEILNASNCSEAVVKITVVNVIDPAPPIIPIVPMAQIVISNASANVDGINGSLEFINILDNDLLNGLPINPADVVITNTTNAYFEFNLDGTVNVKPNTPGGNYSLPFQVCEKGNSSNCGNAILTVFVEVPAIAIIKTAIFNDENNSGFANAGETITYKFKVTNTGNVPLTGVMISDPLPGVVLSGQAIDLEVNQSDDNNFTATYKITQNDINKGSVSNQATVKGASKKGIIVEDKSDGEDNTGDKPTVMPLNGCVIKVFNAFSPNGDEKNKKFYIQGLECYPENTVEIYNRWGVLVYDTDNYNNEDRSFVGFSAGRSTIKQADGLPVGTYFYILKYKDTASNPHELSGYLYINK
ncbi:gliding motility-associated C-terminal domain-containing protein, partial [Flavobacterium sp.]|uniref:T9SS type B sorting domain-containing protein n=1 Tax=Flavobacterium sp. TaxID=239 RepID=UPI00374D188A